MNESRKRITISFLDATFMPYFAGVIDSLVVDNKSIYFDGWSAIFDKTEKIKGGWQK